MLHLKNKSRDSICAKHSLVNSPVNIKPVNIKPVDAEGLEGLYHPVDAEGLEEFGPKVKENDAWRILAIYHTLQSTYTVPKIEKIYTIPEEHKHSPWKEYMSFPPLLHSIEKKCNELLPGIYVAQPYGKLCYAWFTDVCTVIDRTTKKQWTIPIVFEPCLKGTIVSGV